MRYDHSRKIGNQGDLVKHVALVAALRERLAGWSGRFVYADIHAGRPEYVLAEGGAWREGIGAFAGRLRVRGVENDDVREFAERFVGGVVGPGARYRGSSGIAFELLRSAGVPWQMLLWEIDPDAAEESERYFRGQPVEVRRANGYEVIREQPSFVLIDPPALEEEAVLATMADLRHRQVPFLCWTPRPSADHRESESSLRFTRSAAKLGCCLPVRWASWDVRTPGCCITASADLATAVSRAVHAVARVMDWEISPGAIGPPSSR